jgi:hypothetical protein
MKIVRILSAIVTVAVGLPVIAGCSAGVETSTEETTEPITATPPVPVQTGCFTEAIPVSFPNGIGYEFSPPAADGTLKPRVTADLPTYGPTDCPGYFVVEVLNPSVFTQPDELALKMTTAGTLRMGDCLSATASVHTYEHTGSAWNSATYFDQDVSGVWTGSACSFGYLGTLSQTFGGLPSNVDRVRILLGSHLSTGADVPIHLEIDSCTPTTCAAAGATCGQVADGCGGTLTCGTCAAGNVCSANACVCAPQSCPVNTQWNPTLCRCTLPPQPQPHHCVGTTCM